MSRIGSGFSLCSLLFIFFAIIRIEAEVDPADLLFDAFSAKCSGQGRFTNRALGETVALQSMVRTILEDQKDDSCKGLTPVLSQISSLNEQLTFLDQGFDGEQENELQNYIKKLSLYLSATSDPALQGQISTEIASVRWDLTKNSLEQAQAKRRARAEATRQLTEYLSLLASTYPSQKLCFEKNKALPFQMIAQLLSLSSGFFGANVQTVLSLSTSLFDSMLKFLEDDHLVEAIRAYKKTKLQQGLYCALDAMEQTICEIQDYRQLLNAHRDYRRTTETPEKWRGYEILRKQYPILQSFLRQVEGGTPIRSEFQASKRGTFRYKEARFKMAAGDAVGALEALKKKLLELAATSTQDVLIQNKNNVVTGLAYTLANSEAIMEITPDTGLQSRIEIWLRSGTPSPNLPEDRTSSKTLDQRLSEYLEALKNAEKNTDLTEIEKNLNQIVLKASAALNAERVTVFNPDPKSAAVRWTLNSATTRNVASVLADLVEYLKDLKREWQDHPEWFVHPVIQREQIALVDTTMEKFAAAHRYLLDEALDDQKRLVNIFEDFSLEEGDSLITDRLQLIVGMDLQKRIEQGMFSEKDSLKTFVLLNSEDLISAFFPGASDHLTAVERDLSSAENIAKQNLRSFFSFFKDSILTSFDQLYQESVRWNEKFQEGSFDRRISELCILSLNAPQLMTESFRKVREWCDMRSLSTEINGVKVEVHFRDKLKKGIKNPNQRLCAFRQYQDKVELAESMWKNPAVKPASTKADLSSSKPKFLEKIFQLNDRPEN